MKGESSTAHIKEKPAQKQGFIAVMDSKLFCGPKTAAGAYGFWEKWQGGHFSKKGGPEARNRKLRDEGRIQHGSYQRKTRCGSKCNGIICGCRIL
jgi:hypothetical protein